MMNIKQIVNIWILALLVLSAPAQAVKTIEWDKSVIQLELIVGVEQLVHFNGPATVGLPPSLANNDVFRHLFTSETAYWKAMRPFSTQRIKMRLDKTGEFVLFDVTARTEKQPPKAVEPMVIVTEKAATLQQHKSGHKTKKDAITMFDLLRFAVQTDYSPPRVVTKLSGVKALDDKVRSDLSKLYNNTDNSKVDMFVKNMWQAHGWYVTSIIVRNRTKSIVKIDPSKMQHTAKSKVNGVNNQFIASAMIRRIIGPKGGKRRSDSSMIYIVTEHPFSKVIEL